MRVGAGHKSCRRDRGECWVFRMGPGGWCVFSCLDRQSNCDARGRRRGCMKIYNLIGVSPGALQDTVLGSDVRG
jgi:hypothetical protein